MGFCLGNSGLLSQTVKPRKVALLLMSKQLIRTQKKVCLSLHYL